MQLHHQFPPLTDLKKIRLLVGLKQMELETLSGVSQSIIAKTEREERIPRYDTVVKLFTALSDYVDSGMEKEVKNASSIMTKKVKSFQVSATVGEVIKAMKKFDVSQFPCYNGDDLAGTVTERSLLGAQAEDTLKDYIVDALPILSQNTPVRDLEKILKLYSAVLLSDKNGKIVGICSRQDILPA